jgi:hypothetical protein
MRFRLSIEHNIYFMETLGNSHILLFVGLVDRSHIRKIMRPANSTQAFLVLLHLQPNAEIVIKFQVARCVLLMQPYHQN